MCEFEGTVSVPKKTADNDSRTLVFAEWFMGYWITPIRTKYLCYEASSRTI